MNLAISIFWYFRNRFHHDNEINLYIHVDQVYNNGTVSKNIGLFSTTKSITKVIEKENITKRLKEI
jgi:hypothetical protein